MWGFYTVVAAFIVGLIALSFAWGAPIFAVPIVLAIAAGIGLIDFRRRRRQSKEIHEHREEAKAEKIDFTPRDRETLAN